MDQTPSKIPSETIASFLAQAVAKAQLAAATCMGIHRVTIFRKSPEEAPPWHPFKNRGRWQEFTEAAERPLKQRAAPQLSAV